MRKIHYSIVITAILLLVLILMCVILITNNRGPIIEVLNCNDLIITSSKVCHNGTNYFYVSQNEIYRMNSSDQCELLNADYQYDNITCNSTSIFASSNNKLVKLDFNGDIIALSEEPYPIENLLATDSLLVYTYGNIEHVLTPDTLKPISYKLHIHRF